MKLVLIPAGEFMMGSSDEDVEGLLSIYKGGVEATRRHLANEQPQHKVRITKPFYIGQHEVTKGQFAQFILATGYLTEAERYKDGGLGWDSSMGKLVQKQEYSWKNPGFPQNENHPVVLVSWNDTIKFCEWLSKKEERHYQLPTSAEWEYVCRGGTTTIWSNGNDGNKITSIENISDGNLGTLNDRISSSGTLDGYKFTAPVGSYKSNPFGVFDMQGNVKELCQDWYDPEAYKNRTDIVSDPFIKFDQQKMSDLHNWRGGSWFEVVQLCRPGICIGVPAGYSGIFTGFRVNRTN